MIQRWQYAGAIVLLFVLTLVIAAEVYSMLYGVR